MEVSDKKMQAGRVRCGGGYGVGSGWSGVRVRNRAEGIETCTERRRNAGREESSGTMKEKKMTKNRM